jgi:short-subunit dehydrogenase
MNDLKGKVAAITGAGSGIGRALAQELSDTRVKVSCVHPGGIKTNIVNNAKFYKSSDTSMAREESVAVFNRVMANTTAEKAAQIIIAGIKKNKARIMVRTDAYVYDWLKRLFPVWFQRLSGRKVAPAWLKRKAGIKSS